MATPNASRPGRTLVVLLALIGVLFATIWYSVAVSKPKGQWTPKLGLDLEGGTSLVLKPSAPPGSTKPVTSDAVNQAINIMISRVNGSGTTETEIVAQGSGSNQEIVASIPGKRDQKVIDLLEKTALLRFREVLSATAGVPAPTASATGSSAGASPSASATPKVTGSATPSATGNGRIVPQALVPRSAVKAGAKAAGTTPASTPAATPSAAPTSALPTPTPTGSDSLLPVPTSTSDPVAAAELASLDCSKPHAASIDDPTKPLVTCSRDGAVKYLLSAAIMEGATDVSGASAGLLQSGSTGATTGEWAVNLNLTGAGSKKFAAETTKLYNNNQQQFAIVLDGLVVSAPSVNAPGITGTAQITGSFNQASATDLANVLKYGALPLTFTTDSDSAVSPTLGSDQLRGGIIAGIIGLALVVAYSLLYYRGLGAVSIFSLVVASVLTYESVVLLGWKIGFRLSLAGVAGLIVAIGITADSFIVYFERLRDEVREGRSLRAAVESGWKRARRTILAADFVSFLAAVILYLLSVGTVRGFAFTLGLTTVIDVIVVFLFTKPAVTYLARTKFFGGGHRFSGLDPRRLGMKAAPEVRTPLAARRAAARKEI